ncbi:unnamed protein product [Adineta ricciae]|uniref:Uncharacterized protein n=1 Tax=Adineta ricciae TaxID=249248 RepID=A0A815DAK2_ADIRI|nr:unnamed protein product [Adineta ricciae]
MTLMTNTSQEKIVNYGSMQHSVAVEHAQRKSSIKFLIALQILTTVLTLILVGTLYSMTYKHNRVEKHQPYTNIAPTQSNRNGSISVLYVLDPIGHSFCFRDGLYGESITDWTVYNRCSDLDFNAYYKGNFTVGVEGGRVGTIIDLGTATELRTKYKYEETVGDGQGYASIHRQNKTLLILKDYRNRTYQVMDESFELFQEGKVLSTVAVKQGHIYALRISDRYESTFERIVKMLVIAYEPNVSVTIRWEVLF